MRKYAIVTDSGSDLSLDMIKKLGVVSLPLSVTLEGESEANDYEITSETFYSKMRSGKNAKTSAVNYQTFLNCFTRLAEHGYDVLYLGLSSAISSTYSAGRAAANFLKREIPDKEFLSFDTKCASAGLGLLVYLSAKKRDSGADIYEALSFAEETAPRICHRFTVDDLSYLKRGGRISTSTAFFGNMLGIKPLLYMDSGGFLKSSERARGRRASLESLAASFSAFGGEKSNGEIFISHADCLTDAILLDEMLFSKYGVRAKKFFDIGAVIGAHAGPSTLALFFIGNTR